MLCRLLVTAIAISYLMCVLLLSGLQKDDLDENMLKKLQRYNVNMDAMNNENLRAECLSKSSLDSPFNTERNDKDDKLNESTTLEVTRKKESAANGGNLEETRKIDAQTVMNYIINARIKQERPKFNEEDFVINRTRNPNNMQTSNFKDNFNIFTYSKKPEVIQNKADIEYNKGKQRVESLMKFWNMYTTNDEIVTQMTEIITRPFIDKENELSNSRQFDIDDISRQIKIFLGNQPNIQQFLSNNKVDTNNAKKIIGNSINNNNNRRFYIPPEKSYRAQDIDPIRINKPKYNEEEKLITKNNSIQYIDDILKLNDQLKLFGPLQNTQNPNINYRNYLQAETNKILLKPYEMSYTKPALNITPNVDNNMNKKQLKMLPEDLIKEIAQSVEAIVLKDLQKEIHSSISTAETTSIVTTTEKVTTTTQRQDKENAQDVIEKLMEIYQQFKSIKESTQNADKKYTATEKNIMQEWPKWPIQHSNGPLNIMYPVISSGNPYTMRSRPANISPALPNPYSQDTHINIPTFQSLPLKPNSFNKITQLNIFNHKNEYSLSPITLQTNSDEIPPLGIPISKPIKLLNQNIIVSTKKPYFETRNERQYPDYMFGNNRNYNNVNNENRSRKERFETNFNSPPRLRHNDNSVHSYFRENKDDADFLTRIRDKSNHGNGLNDNRIRYHTPRFDNFNSERIHPRSYEVKGFHEKLERTDNWPRRDESVFEDRDDCCKLKVASRQQLPLSDVKKRSRYDDTHFRNFLKTQEKVNNMLERILAINTKSDGPHSVETT